MNKYEFICEGCGEKHVVDRHVEDRNIPPEKCLCGSVAFIRSFMIGNVEHKQGPQKGNWNRYTTKVNGRSV